MNTQIIYKTEYIIWARRFYIHTFNTAFTYIKVITTKNEIKCVEKMFEDTKSDRQYSVQKKKDKRERTNNYLQRARQEVWSKKGLYLEYYLKKGLLVVGNLLQTIQ